MHNTNYILTNEMLIYFILLTNAVIAGLMPAGTEGHRRNLPPFYNQILFTTQVIDNR